MGRLHSIRPLLLAVGATVVGGSWSAVAWADHHAHPKVAGERVDEGAHKTMRHGVHACPSQMVVSGVNEDNDSLLCVPGPHLQMSSETVLPGNGQNIINKGDEWVFHGCPSGYLMTGLNRSTDGDRNHNTLLCTKILDKNVKPQNWEWYNEGGDFQRDGHHVCAENSPPYLIGIRDGTTFHPERILCGLQVGAPTICGEAKVRYMVETVVPAAPSVANGPKSTVVYGSTQTAGTQVSSSKSFSESSSLSISVEAHANDTSVGAGFNFGTTDGNSSTDAQSVQHTSGLQIATSGPTILGPDGKTPVDGVIDHGADYIYIYPNVPIELCGNQQTKAVSWAIAPGPGSTTFLLLQAGWLAKWIAGDVPTPANQSQRPVGETPAYKDALKYGLTTADFREILSHDPLYALAGGDSSGHAMKAITIEELEQANKKFPGRYQVHSPISLPYDPNVQAQVTNVDVSSVSNMTGTNHSYTVGVSFSASIGGSFLGVGASVKMSSSTQWTWNSSSSNTSTHGQQASAAITLQPPTTNADFDAFNLVWDNLYRTFVVLPQPSNWPAAVTGTAKPNSEIHVQLPSGKSVVAHTNNLGKFVVRAKGESGAVKVTHRASGATATTTTGQSVKL